MKKKQKVLKADDCSEGKKRDHQKAYKNSEISLDRRGERGSLTHSRPLRKRKRLVQRKAGAAR